MVAPKKLLTEISFGVILYVPVGNSMKIPDGLVVLTFDDGNKSDLDFVAPLLKSHGFGATFFITEGLNFLTHKQHYLTWPEVRQLHDLGFEIGNHTQRHKNVTQQSAEELLADIVHIDQRCLDYGLPQPITFCYPGYQHNVDAVEVLNWHEFRFARRGVAPEFTYDSRGGRGPAYDPEAHHPLLIPTTGAAGPHWQWDDFLWALDQAGKGEICVLTFHGVPALEHPWVNTEPAQFEQYMQHLKDNQFQVVALRDLAVMIPPS